MDIVTAISYTSASILNV